MCFPQAGPASHLPPAAPHGSPRGATSPRGPPPWRGPCRPRHARLVLTGDAQSSLLTSSPRPCFLRPEPPPDPRPPTPTPTPTALLHVCSAQTPARGWGLPSPKAARACPGPHVPLRQRPDPRLSPPESDPGLELPASGAGSGWAFPGSAQGRHAGSVCEDIRSTAGHHAGQPHVLVCWVAPTSACHPRVIISRAPPFHLQSIPIWVPRCARAPPKEASGGTRLGPSGLPSPLPTPSLRHVSHRHSEAGASRRKPNVQNDAT